MYPGLGWGVIGSNVVDLGLAIISLIFNVCFIFKEHKQMLELFPNLLCLEDDLLSSFQ